MEREVRDLLRLRKKELAKLGYKRKTFIISVDSAIALEMEAARSQSSEGEVLGGLIEKLLKS